MTILYLKENRQKTQNISASWCRKALETGSISNDDLLTIAKMIQGLARNQYLNYLYLLFDLDKLFPAIDKSVLILDNKNNIKKVNKATLGNLGFKDDELINRHIKTILVNQPESTLENSIKAGQMETLKVHYQSKEGNQIPVCFSSYSPNNELEQETICVAKQLEPQNQLQVELHDSRQKYRLMTQITNDGLWDWNLKSDTIIFSARWKASIGYQDGEISDSLQEWLSRVHPKDIQQLENYLSACTKGAISQFEIEYSLLHKDGNYREMQCRCIVTKNKLTENRHLIGSQTDITQCRKIEAQLKYQASYDKLTGLPNRNLFVQQLEQLFDSAKQKPHHLFAILFLDLDRFKTVNDSCGHFIGDRLLIETARRLERCLDSKDIVARLGGDEFAILLTNFSHANVPTEIADRIQQEFDLPIEIGDRPIFITASVGIAITDGTSDRLSELLRDAEIAMYQAKARGKARHAVFEKAMHLKNLQKLELEHDLRQALEEKQFELYYQPIVELVNSQIVGFEALMRWQHPTRGLISPGKFIPLAAETGLIVPMGWWALREACDRMAQWQQQYPQYEDLTISVNISGKQLCQPYASYIVAQILQQTGVDPHRLKLEITESEVIENIEETLVTLAELKGLGIKLSMDDFGTGYSSLSYLHRLPVDTLKIDRSFVMDIEKDSSKLELVKTIIQLAAIFKLDAIAEGIETNTQHDLLVGLECQYGQGYLFAKPLTQEKVQSLLNDLPASHL